jgi:hypothetical protein
MATEKVELGFDDNAPGNWFVLDNSIRGLLDNSTYVLQGGSFYDVTQYITNISSSRGKNRELSRFNAGQFSATFKNRNRYFDPTYTGSPFYGQIVPRRAIRYSVDNIVQFVGVVDDWDLSYTIDGNNEATVTAYDGFTKFANQTLTAGTATSELSGTRIGKVLDDPKVNWGYANRNIDAGNETLQADVIAANQDVLQYINLIETTEGGQFFVDRNGNATWKARNSIWTTATNATIADDGTGIPYTGIQVVYGSELLYNQVSYSRLNGGTAVANDYISQSAYGVRNLTDTGLLNNSDTALANMAAYTANLYRNPEFRFEQVDFALHDMSAVNRATLLSLDVGSVVTIKFTPAGIPPVISKYAAVIGISHSAVYTGNHIMSVKFQTLDVATFVLDSAVFGLLDLNLLAF